MMMIDDPKIEHAEPEPTYKHYAIVSTTVENGLILMSIWYESEVWRKNLKLGD